MRRDTAPTASAGALHGHHHQVEEDATERSRGTIRSRQASAAVRNDVRAGGALRALVVEVLDDLAGPRPLVRRDNEVDVASAEPVERVIGDAAGVEAHMTELIPPGEGSVLLLERAHRLPALEARIADGNRLFPGTPSEARDMHTPSVRIRRSAAGRQRAAAIARAGSTLAARCASGRLLGERFRLLRTPGGETAACRRLTSRRSRQTARYRRAAQ